jgi:hypothetical protein
MKNAIRTANRTLCNEVQYSFFPYQECAIYVGFIGFCGSSIRKVANNQNFGAKQQILIIFDVATYWTVVSSTDLQCTQEGIIPHLTSIM